jgi:Spy/CpxP family protein refolding chaperone
MFGFIVGIACLVAFFAVLRRRRGWRYGGCHGRHFGRGGRFGMYRVLEELDTSPGQEKAIRAAVQDLRGSLRELRPGLEEARRQVANALRGEPFDTGTLEASLQGQTRELGKLSSAIAVTLGKVHEALDPDQRRRLARWIELGPGLSWG